MPIENRENIQEAVRFLKDNKIRACVNTLFLLPQTPLWYYAKSIGRAPSDLEIATRFTQEYYQNNRSRPTVNLSDASDEEISVAVREIWENNKIVGY